VQLSYSRNKVIENTRITDSIFKLVVNGNFDADPGQFFMLRAWGKEPILSRPISICDKDENKLVFLYEVRGEGTDLFSRLGSNDEIELLGPLGKGFDPEKISGKVAMVTGGIGIAPMLLTAKSIKAESIDLFAGFREHSYLINDFREYVDDIKIATDLGTEGHKGFVTEIIDPGKYDVVLCCGPEVMMKKIVESCNEANVTVYVSMESHMACGIGACLVCTCKTKYGMKRTCKDGPVFLGKDVIFNA
jgi:dihydroorotate dehydrogenase electron transfer subunit